VKDQCRILNFETHQTGYERKAGRANQPRRRVLSNVAKKSHRQEKVLRTKKRMWNWGPKEHEKSKITRHARSLTGQKTVRLEVNKKASFGFDSEAVFAQKPPKKKSVSAQKKKEEVRNGRRTVRGTSLKSRTTRGKIRTSKEDQQLNLRRKESWSKERSRKDYDALADREAAFSPN